MIADQYIKITELNDDENTMKAIVTCVYCGKEQKPLVLNQDKWQEFRYRGGFVQDMFPALSPDDRELLVSGTCSVCWDNLMPCEDCGSWDFGNDGRKIHEFDCAKNVDSNSHT